MTEPVPTAEQWDDPENPEDAYPEVEEFEPVETADPEEPDSLVDAEEGTSVLAEPGEADPADVAEQAIGLSEDGDGDEDDYDRGA